LCKQYSLSQDTVLMAYNDLKSKGIITSQVGKGYFISNTKSDVQHKVLLLFDTLTAYKENLYEAIKSVLVTNGSEQIFFHNNNLKMFQTILEGSAGEYTEYVIMPIDHPSAFEAIGKLPSNKVYILDQGREQYKEIYPYVCQDFERDIYRVLKGNGTLVKKYKRMVLVVPQLKAHFRSIAVGFKDFCRQFPVQSEIVINIRLFPIRPYDGFVVVDDKDLEFIIRWTGEHDLELGRDIGIISYNETPLKGIVASGITTISTDFSQMGKSMADMILGGKKDKIDNPFKIILRKSF
jgi:DNA-binding LacI/PurR family transcriptional regulator